MKPQALLIFLLISTHLFSQPTVQEVQFFPPQYTVGDQVQLRIILDNTQNIPLFVPEIMPSSQWLEVTDARIIPGIGRTQILIQFVPFSPGTKTITPIDFGGFVLQEQKIHTQSILEETGRELSLSQDPILLPQTEAFAALFLLGLVLVPAGIIFLIRLGIKLYKKISSGLGRSRPMRVYRREVDKLGTKVFGTSTNFFYHALLGLFKNYLAQSRDIAVSSSTNRELLELILPEFEEENKKIIRQLFNRMDQALFGSGEYTEQQRLEDMGTVSDMVQELSDHLEVPQENTEEAVHA